MSISNHARASIFTRTLIALFLAWPAVAHADCPPGMDIAPNAPEICCWPGQTYVAATNRCAGPPACRPGWVAQGLECIAQPAPQHATWSPQAQPANPPPAYGQAQYAQPAYGQAQYAQPVQPANSQPQYAQPTYAQPAYAQPQAPATAYGQPSTVVPATQRLSLWDRPMHFEWGLHFAGIVIPSGGSVIGVVYPHLTIGWRQRMFDMRLNAGFLYVHSPTNDGFGAFIGVDPHLWVAHVYGIGACIGLAHIGFVPLSSGGWDGFSTGIVALATPVALQFGTGRVRFEADLKLGLYWFPDHTNQPAGVSPFGFLSAGVIFG